MSYFHVSKVTTKGQVVISKALRRSHAMPPGTKVMLIPGKDEIRVRALNRACFDRFAGILGRDGRALTELLRSRREGERHAAARALQENAELVTGDPEFCRIENDVDIRWIGRAHAESRDSNS